MKIAITTTGEDLDALLDNRFGRTSKFLIYDLEADSFEIIDNAQNLNAVQGAGIQAAQTVAETESKAVITGNVGPKAFRTLLAAGINVFLCTDCTGKDAVENFKAGNLKEQNTANVQGHW